MNPIDAATAFLAWAYEEGLTGLEAPPPAAPPQDLALLSNISAEARTFLRERSIQGVAANTAGHEIVVFLRRAAPKAKKALDKLPSLVGDVAVKYKQGVTSPVDANPPAPFGGPPYALKQVNQSVCYTCGSSISVGNFREAGTLGALVRDGTGRLFGLSNAHVVSSCNHATMRTPIVAPGIADVCAQNHPPFTIGAYVNSLPLISGSPDTVAWLNNADAACFEIQDPTKVSSSQQNYYDTPSSCSPLTTGINVEKVGRTTGHTQGKIVGAMSGYFAMPYQAAAYDFKGIVYLPSVFVAEGYGKAFSEAGDSGSLVVQTDAAGIKSAVALVFAGMQSGTAAGGCYSLLLPIEPILTRLGMQLVSAHNI